MKKFLETLLVGLFFLWACSDDSTYSYEITGVTDAGEFIDTRDNKTYHCIEIGDQIWMAENLAYLLPGGNLAGCATWQETYFDTLSVPLNDSEFREALSTALETGKIDESPCMDSLNNFMLGYGVDESSVWYEMYYEMFAPTYLPSVYLKNNPDASYDKIISDMKDSVSGNCYYLIYPQIELFANNMRILKIPEYALTNYQKAEENNGNYSQTYGMLYSYEAALKAVPSEGDWRLPTDEDWKKLERFLGMSEGEVPKDNDWRGTNQAEYLKADKNGIGFNVLYGGGKIYTPRYNKMEDDQTFINKGRNAYFWSSENLAETDSTRVGIMRSIATWTNQILRSTTRFENEDGHPTMYNVRLVKDKK